jgi:hypothetical protein
LGPWNGSYPPVKLLTSMTCGVEKENSSFRRTKYFGTRGLIILQLSCYYYVTKTVEISDEPIGSWSLFGGVKVEC